MCVGELPANLPPPFRVNEFVKHICGNPREARNICREEHALLKASVEGVCRTRNLRGAGRVSLPVCTYVYPCRIYHRVAEGVWPETRADVSTHVHAKKYRNGHPRQLSKI